MAFLVRSRKVMFVLRLTNHSSSATRQIGRYSTPFLLTRLYSSSSGPESSKFPLPRPFIDFTEQNANMQFLVSSQESFPSSDASDRHELQSKLETLESIGCTKDQVHESPEILLLTEQEILQRFARLRQCGFKHINVMMLKLAYLKSKSVLQERISELQRATDGKETIGASVAGKLQYNELEWYRAKKKYVYLRHIRSMPFFNAKVDFLFLSGFAIEDIKKNILVLNKTLNCLQERVRQTEDLGLRTKLNLSVLNYTNLAFTKWLHNAHARQKALGGFSNRFEVFAHLLNVSVEDIQEIPVFGKYSVQRLRSLIELLLSHGIKTDDILCHPYIFLRSSKRIKQSIEDLSALGITSLTIVQMSNVLSGRRVSKRQTKKHELEKLAELLEADVQVLESHKFLLKPTLLKGKYGLRDSIAYLRGNGFDSKSILACPIILGHDLTVLKSYIETFKDHSDFKTVDKLFGNDMGKILNWIQYLIERDINFSSQEAIEEGDPDLKELGPLD